MPAAACWASGAALRQVTLNVCLGAAFAGGALVFYGMRDAQFGAVWRAAEHPRCDQLPAIAESEHLAPVCFPGQPPI